MSTLHVTIGGKEVSLTPGEWAHRASSAAAPIIPPQERHAASRARQLAPIVGLLAALGLLILLIVWLSQPRHHR